MWNCVSEMAKPCGAGRLGVKADDQVDVLDVVDHAAVRMAKAVVDRLAVGVELRGGDDLRRVAAVLAVDLAHRRHQFALLFEASGESRQAACR